MDDTNQHPNLQPDNRWKCSLPADPQKEAHCEATGQLLSPVVAALAMSLGSVSVVMNALWLQAAKGLA